MDAGDFEKALQALHKATVDTLLKRVSDGTATAADLAVARQLLKDHGITAVPKKGGNLDQLQRVALPLPEFDDEEGSVVPFKGRQ